MADKKLVCKKCGRKFAMAAHLARHTSAAHGSGAARKRKKKVKRRAAKKVTARRTGASAARPSTSGVLRELRAVHRHLCAQRSALDAEITDIEDVIAKLGGARRTKRRRVRRR